MLYCILKILCDRGLGLNLPKLVLKVWPDVQVPLDITDKLVKICNVPLDITQKSLRVWPDTCVLAVAAIHKFLRVEPDVSVLAALTRCFPVNLNMAAIVFLLLNDVCVK